MVPAHNERILQRLFGNSKVQSPTNRINIFQITNLKYFYETQVNKIGALPPWLSPVERLAVNQSVKGSNPFGGATSQLHLYLFYFPFFSFEQSTVFSLNFEAPVSSSNSLSAQVFHCIDCAFWCGREIRYAGTPLRFAEGCF